MSMTALRLPDMIDRLMSTDSGFFGATSEGAIFKLTVDGPLWVLTKVVEPPTGTWRKR